MLDTTLTFCPKPNHKNFKDLTGLTFHRLTVLGLAGKRRNDVKSPYLWYCRCECGDIKAYEMGNLRKGNTVSCGCFARENVAKRNTKHSMSNTPTYRSWSSMLSRCTNPRHPGWFRYGGRGIDVCDVWRSFPNFLADMGIRPFNTSLDRINNELGYSPDNCKWSSPTEQQNNTRQNRWLSFQGQTLCVTQWAKYLQCGPPVLFARIRAGWSVEKILTTPVRYKSLAR
jgi:hypothetical protein